MDTKIEKNIDKIRNTLETKGKVEFVIYSLNYIIEKVDNKYIIYSKNDSNRKQTYYNIDLLFKNYTIYNENLKENDNKILYIK